MSARLSVPESLDEGFVLHSYMQQHCCRIVRAAHAPAEWMVQRPTDLRYLTDAGRWDSWRRGTRFQKRSEAEDCANKLINGETG